MRPFLFRCEQGKYYVSRTLYPCAARSTWLQMYRPIYATMVGIMAAEIDGAEGNIGPNWTVERWTRYYMIQYGLDNVRGDAYPNTELIPTVARELCRIVACEKKKEINLFGIV